MKLFLTLLLCLFPLTAFATDPANWDLLDEDCAGIGDWVDGDTNTGVSEVDPAGQFRFDTNLGAAGNARAIRTRDVGDTPNTFTYEVRIYHDAIGTRAGGDWFRVRADQADEEFLAYFATDGLFILDTDDGYQEIGADLVKHGGAAAWQTWRFLVTFGAVGDGTCDVFLSNDDGANWTEEGTNVTCSYENPSVDGTVGLQQRGNTTDNMVTHTDYVKIATGLFDPTEVAVAASQVIRVITSD